MMNEKPSVSKILAQRLALPAHSSMVLKRRVRRLAELIAGLLPEEELKGLDLGCGSGEVSRHLMDLRPDLKVSGSDLIVRPDAVIDVVGSNADNLPFPDGSFDFIFLIDVLHHTLDPAAILREASRASGRFVIIKDHYCQNQFDHFVLSFMDWVGNRAHDIPLPNNYLSRNQWQKLVADCGLRLRHELTSLELYSKPISWFFDRDLHFIALFEKVSAS